MEISLLLGMEIALATFVMGSLLGLVGAGGAGVVIALLTLGFGIPIHLALGTSLAAMAFTTLSGTISHYREGNVTLKVGLPMGLFGAIGAFGGTRLASVVPGEYLHYCTGMMLIISAVLIYLRVYHPEDGPFKANTYLLESGPRFWISSVFGGLLVGFLSGTFGVGSTPFIQLLLMIVFGLSLFRTVGTTMLVILPVAISGGTGYFLAGHLNFILLLAVLVGLTCGAYVGAKGTRRVPKWFLKLMMVATPAIGGLLLLIR